MTHKKTGRKPLLKLAQYLLHGEAFSLNGDGLWLMQVCQMSFATSSSITFRPKNPLVPLVGDQRLAIMTRCA
ncbi:hypothetical protein [Rosistilla oblonga]|uniref:hypothetical protein n=1 Tax=Rosistilla oblonga TaxID=2527990 RepID=UPI003A977FAA